MFQDLVSPEKKHKRNNTKCCLKPVRESSFHRYCDLSITVMDNDQNFCHSVFFVNQIDVNHHTLNTVRSIDFFVT